MPWRCPACQSPIKHSGSESHPTIGARYRCHVCRLELTLNERTNKLDVTPLESASDTNPRSAKRRSKT